MNELATNNQIVTSVGLNLPENTTEEQFIEVGRTLGNIEKGMQWAVGDWYNNIEGKTNQYHNEEGKKAVCERVGLSYKTANNCGYVANAFRRPARAEQLTFKHHAKLTLSDLTDAQRQQLLARAVQGETVKGKHKVWSAKKLMEARDKLLGTWVEPVNVNEPDAIASFVEKSIEKVPERYKKQIIKLAHGLAASLAHDFDVQVKAEVAKRTKEETASLTQLRKKVVEEKLRFEALNHNLDGLMSENEYRLIRGCLHPDRAPRERQAQFSKAFDIFTRLEKSVNRKLPNRVKEQRGWA